LSGWHLITGEYPPQAGGVSDYTQLVAAGLAAAGDEVHVWCPPATNGTTSAAVETSAASSVRVHRELGRFRLADLRRVGRMLDEFDGSRRLLVQWVPHGYGYRSMNLPFCLWLWQRAMRRGDAVELMVHEPYLSFTGSWKQSGAAVVHRLMTLVLLNAARRVWMTIPAWEAYWRPYALGRALPFQWLPVASNIAVVPDAAGVGAIRQRYTPAGEHVVGHFGTYDRHSTEALLRSVPALLQGCAACVLLLLGRGGEALRDELTRRQPELARRIHATGTLAADTLSLHIAACDVILQPYIDGVSSRRTSVMVCLAHGRPVVTTRGPLTETFWADTDAVTLAPAGDDAALVETTRSLLADDARRHHMSAAAEKLYAERFDVQRIVAALREATV